jgi:hypothetical protein
VRFSESDDWSGPLHGIAKSHRDISLFLLPRLFVLGIKRSFLDLECLVKKERNIGSASLNFDTSLQ